MRRLDPRFLRYRFGVDGLPHEPLGDRDRLRLGGTMLRAPAAQPPASRTRGRCARPRPLCPRRLGPESRECVLRHCELTRTRRPAERDPLRHTTSAPIRTTTPGRPATCGSEPCRQSGHSSSFPLRRVAALRTLILTPKRKKLRAQAPSPSRGSRSGADSQTVPSRSRRLPSPASGELRGGPPRSSRSQCSTRGERSARRQRSPRGNSRAMRVQDHQLYRDAPRAPSYSRTLYLAISPRTALAEVRRRTASP